MKTLSVPSKHLHPRSISSWSHRENIFDSLEIAHGPYPYACLEKCKKVRGAVIRFIRGNGGYRNVVFRVVRDAMAYHDRNHLETCHLGKRIYRDVDLKCVSSNVLVIAASCCQKYCIKEKDLIKQVLFKLFYCEGHLDRFMTFLDPLVFPFEVDSILYPFNMYTHMGTISKKHLDVLEYFLKYGVDIDINVQYTEFNVNSPPVRSQYVTFNSSIPLVDVPIASCRGSTPLLLACQSISAEAVLLLLRHGADPLRSGQVHQIVGLQFQHPLFVISTKLNASVFWRTHNQHLNPVLRCQFLDKQLAQDDELKLILRYFARVVPSLPLAISNQLSSDGRFRSPESEAFHLHECYRDLVPTERLETAAELTHLCRCEIRKLLVLNRKLPGGIYELPLPKSILEYIDILSD